MSFCRREGCNPENHVSSPLLSREYQCFCECTQLRLVGAKLISASSAEQESVLPLNLMHYFAGFAKLHCINFEISKLAFPNCRRLGKGVHCEVTIGSHSRDSYQYSTDLQKGQPVTEEHPATQQDKDCLYMPKDLHKRD